MAVFGIPAPSNPSDNDDTQRNRLLSPRVAKALVYTNIYYMDSSLHEVWQAAAGSPFLPAISKSSQFWVAFILLLLGFSATGVFALSMLLKLCVQSLALSLMQNPDRSLVNVFVVGLPGSLALA